MKKTTLRRCPFCGGNASIRQISIGNTFDGWTDTWRVECANCGASPSRYGFNSLIKRDKDDNIVVEADGRISAIDSWNNRPF